MGLWKVTTGGLLLSLSLTLLALGAEGQGNGWGKKQISGRGPVNLGQQRGTWWPLLQTRENLSEVRSIKSTFEFRTYDPEGAVFYGDTKAGDDWFVLSLRNGIPEMQIGKADILVSVAGGPKLNDGLWHQMELRSEGKFVVLEVDGQRALMVGLESKQTEEVLTGLIRLALGGILVDEKKLVDPFQPEMDGCVREGSWLNLSTPWETDLPGEPLPCYQHIQRGSYFPGNGLAVFNTSDFIIQTEASGIKIEIYGELSKMDGTILSIKAPGQGPMLTVTVNNGTKDLTLIFGKYLKDLTTVDFNRPLSITLLKNTVKVESESLIIMDNNELPNILTSWKEGMTLAFGGLPGDGEDYSGSQYLQGCVENIQIQGKDLDLDRALYKHISVSSYSCPL